MFAQASNKYVLKIIFIFDAPYLDVLNIHMLYIGIVRRSSDISSDATAMLCI